MPSPSGLGLAPVDWVDCCISLFQCLFGYVKCDAIISFCDN